jgi:3-phosphoshikimate 1-carboxyvinyltransferase
MLRRFGANIHAQGSTLYVEGPTPLKGAEIDSFKDHRIAMSAAVAALAAAGETTIRDTACINTSFPGFWDLLNKCGGQAVRLTPP